MREGAGMREPPGSGLGGGGGGSTRLITALSLLPTPLGLIKPGFPIPTLRLWSSHSGSTR